MKNQFLTFQCTKFTKWLLLQAPKQQNSRLGWDACEWVYTCSFNLIKPHKYRNNLLIFMVKELLYIIGTLGLVISQALQCFAFTQVGLMVVNLSVLYLGNYFCPSWNVKGYSKMLRTSLQTSKNCFVKN